MRLIWLKLLLATVGMSLLALYWARAASDPEPPTFMYISPEPPVVGYPVRVVLHHPLADIRAATLQWRFAGQTDWRSLPGCELTLPQVSEQPLRLQFRTVDAYGRASLATDLIRVPVQPHPRLWVFRTEPTRGPRYGQHFRIWPVGQSPLLRKVQLEWRLPGETVWKPASASGIALPPVHTLRVRVELRAVDETGLASVPAVHAWDTDPLVRSYPVMRPTGARSLIPLYALALVPGADLVFLGGEDGFLGLLDLRDGQVKFLQAHSAGKTVYDVAVLRTQSGQVLGLSAGEDGLAVVWDLESNKILHRLVGHGGSINAVAFSPDGHFAFTCGQDGVCLVWDIESGKIVGKLPVSTNPLTCIRSWMDGKDTLLAIGAADKKFHIWNVNLGKPLCSQEADGEKVWVIATYPDVRILTGGDLPYVRMWRFRDGTVQQQFDLAPAVPSWAFASLGGSVASTAAKIDPNLNPLRSERLLYSDETFLAADFTPEAKYALACDRAGRLIMWDLTNGLAVRTLLQPDTNISHRDLGLSDLQITSDGQFAVTADRAGYVRIWFIGERP